MSLETTAWIVSLAGAAAFVIGGFVVGRGGRGRALEMASVGDGGAGGSSAQAALGWRWATCSARPGRLLASATGPIGRTG